MALSSASKRIRLLILCTALPAALPALRADVVAADGAVGNRLYDSGTEGNPSVYLIGQDGPVTTGTDANVTWLGGSYDHLVVQNGSVYSSGGYVYVGQEAGEDHNLAHVTGGSTWNVRYDLYVGIGGSHNALVVDGGSHVNITDYGLHVGRYDSSYTGTSSYNTATVSGPGSTLDAAQGIIVGSAGSHNSLLVENGATVSAGYYTNIGSSGSDNNSLVITGAGSRFDSAESIQLANYGGAGNTITLTDGGLLVGEDGLSVGFNQNNFVNLNGGFLALAGDQSWWINSFITNGAFRYWDGSAWVVGDASDFSFDYFDDEADALAFSGYEGLGGYTLVTAPYLAPVPEPAVCAALAGLGVLALAAWRRRR